MAGAASFLSQMPRRLQLSQSQPGLEAGEHPAQHPSRVLPQIQPSLYETTQAPQEKRVEEKRVKSVSASVLLQPEVKSAILWVTGKVSQTSCSCAKDLN